MIGSSAPSSRPTIIVHHSGFGSTTGSEEDLNRLGFWLGAGAQSNVDQGPELAPPDADLRTAAHLGERVASTTLRLLHGAATAQTAPA